MIPLSDRYGEALVYALALHRDQLRKQTQVPYVSHLLAVSALVLENRGDEEQATAALLHDALEDQGDRTSYAEITARFGDRVAEIVRACTDTEQTPKPPWRERKERYLAHLAGAGPDVLLVSCADKVHNARSIVADLRELGEQTWGRFNAGRDGQLWYYRSLGEIFKAGLPGSRLPEEYTRVLQEMAGLSGA